jgi:hypothetical protein
MNLRKELEVVDVDGRPTIEPEALASRLDTRRPEILAVAGTIGLLLLVWLMVVKPG